ncbi:3-ketoacyl-CoA synthase 2-like protein [Drosera capensis]
MIFIILALLVLTIISLMITKKPKRNVYLVDFSCYKPNPSQEFTKEEMLSKMKRHISNISDATLDFTSKMLERSGIGPVTYGPKGLLMDPPDVCLARAREEADEVLFGAVDMLLAKTGVDPAKIGIVVTNCCVFNPVPSLSDMIMNRHKMKDDVLSYNISGMGCSASLIAVGLAKQLLQVHKDKYALIVSTENITENFYQGNNRAILLINCLFRLGGGAILLSNRSSVRHSSKYELRHTVHTCKASTDLSYNCIIQEEDDEGNRGIPVTKDLLAAAFKAVEVNLTTMGSLILPVSDQLRFVANYIMRKLNKDNIKPYVPNFKGSTDHFYCHVGGKPVLDELQSILRMTEGDMEASRMTLYRWGNMSSSTIWYEMAYNEAKGRVKKGDRVWHIAFGSGFKCSSVTWRALRTVAAREKGNPWTDEIDKFPLDWNMDEFPFHLDPLH